MVVQDIQNAMERENTYMNRDALLTLGITKLLQFLVNPIKLDSDWYL